MQIVIDIPEYEYQDILHTGKASFCVVNAIEAGTILPKGHGDIVDVDSIISVTLEDSLHIMKHLKGDEVDCQIEAPTIIEADTESEE